MSEVDTVNFDAETETIRAISAHEQAALDVLGSSHFKAIVNEAARLSVETTKRTQADLSYHRRHDQHYGSENSDSVRQ